MYSPFRHINSVLWKRGPIHLTFFLTKRCNSKCPYCFYLGMSDKTKSLEELSLDEIGKISRSMGNLLWLAFSGGEIFLRDDLVEISKIFYENNKPSVILYPTNGLLPEVIREKTEQILSYCKKSVITVKLSIDGLYEKHDMLRNTPGTFEKTIKTYSLLKDFLNKHPNFELGINTVFCSKNQDNMDEIIDYVNGMKDIRTHTISMIRGNLADESYKKVDYKKYLDAIKKLEDNLKTKKSSIYRFRGARIKAAQDILQRQLIHKTMLEHRQQIPCYAGKLNLVLTENGDVYPCEILTKAIDNIKKYNYDMEKLIHSRKTREVINMIKDNKCFCTHECYFMINILFNPRLYPLILKEYIHI